VLWLLLGCATAAAQPRGAPCGEVVSGWVAEASRAIGVRAEAMQCPPGMARVRLSPAGAAPFDVEVAEPPGPAFRHAGRLRVSPIVDVPDYADLPAEQRAAYQGLVGWLEANEARVRFESGREPAARAIELTGPGIRDAGLWLLAAALVLIAVGLWLRRATRGAADAAPTRPSSSPPSASSARSRLERAPASDWATAGALLVAALVPRLALGLFRPLHVNGQGPLWIRGALDEPSALASYGPGYAELFGPFARAFEGAPDHAVFAINAILSAAVPALVFAAARAHGLDRGRALLAGLLIALDPVSIRIAPTEAYVTPIAALVAASFLLCSIEASRRAAPWLVAGAALLCAQACRIHPVAWLPVALVPLAALPRLVPALSTAAAIAATAWLTSGGWLAAVLDHSVASGPGTDLLGRALDSGFASDAILVALVAAAAVVLNRVRSRTVAPSTAHAEPAGRAATGPARDARPPAPAPRTAHAEPAGRALRPAAHDLALIVLAVACVLADLATRHAYGQSQLWQASYDRLFAPGLALGLAAVAPRDLRVRWAMTLPAAFAAAVFVQAAGPLTTETTEQREHAFLRDALAELDPACRIAHVPRVERRLTEIPTWAHRGDAPPIRVQHADDVRTAAPACAYFVRTSICSSRDARALCDAIPTTGSPVAAAVFPAVPSYEGLGYDRDPVPVTIHTAVAGEER